MSSLLRHFADRPQILVSYFKLKFSHLDNCKRSEMINRKTYLFVVLFVALFVPASLYAQDNSIVKKDQIKKNEPVEIVCDRIDVYYKKDQIGKNEVEEKSDLEKIEAKGNVSITQGERRATGDEAVYYQDTGQFILTSNALLREGKNSIKGCRIIVYLNENRGKAEACSPEKKERVKAVIYPSNKKGEQNKQELFGNGK
jgi:lipopolysaccharide transport protein LptA